MTPSNFRYYDKIGDEIEKISRSQRNSIKICEAKKKKKSVSFLEEPLKLSEKSKKGSSKNLSHSYRKKAKSAF
jgi:hypothetical protein